MGMGFDSAELAARKPPFLRAQLWTLGESLFLGSCPACVTLGVYFSSVAPTFPGDPPSVSFLGVSTRAKWGQCDFLDRNYGPAL